MCSAETADDPKKGKKAKVKGYIADMDSAELAAPYLRDFIKLLKSDKTKKIHIIAHSMGNVVLTKALLLLKGEKLFPSKIINQIILVAPDIDRDIFINQIAPQITGHVRFTLYASGNDKALIASRKIRQDYMRAGQGGTEIVVVDGVESIDASRVDTSLLGMATSLIPRLF